MLARDRDVGSPPLDIFLDTTKTQFGFSDLNPNVKVIGGFSIKKQRSVINHWMEFSMDRYIVTLFLRSQEDVDVTVSLDWHVNLAILKENGTPGKAQMGDTCFCQCSFSSL